MPLPPPSTIFGGLTRLLIINSQEVARHHHLLSYANPQVNKGSLLPLHLTCQNQPCTHLELCMILTCGHTNVTAATTDTHHNSNKNNYDSF